ncbi:tetratricopeptide repeat protein [Alphaproteobacteria bacterium]|jgi:tetratricopeptide (TPR) repeat protein|nr:tetratricopeptide repeat protein [Alphaproteobacteria bacterium]
MKILLSLIFLIFSSLAFSAGTNNSASDDQGTSVTKDFKNAQKLIYSKKYEKAIDILISLEDKKPIGFSKADLYNYLGFATRKKNNPNYEDAEEYYLSALSIDANHIGALEYLGELYFETDRLGQAEELLMKLGAVAGKNSVEYKELFDLLN